MNDLDWAVLKGVTKMLAVYMLIVVVLLVLILD